MARVLPPMSFFAAYVEAAAISQMKRGVRGRTERQFLPPGFSPRGATRKRGLLRGDTVLRRDTDVAKDHEKNTP
jgi:hypothetical protein